VAVHPKLDRVMMHLAKLGPQGRAITVRVFDHYVLHVAKQARIDLGVHVPEEMTHAGHDPYRARGLE
jgi:hypothetical protein